MNFLITAPLDRNPDRSYQPNQGHPNLSDDEVVNAMASLNNRDFIKKFLSVERRYADPVDALQRIGLISFTPAKGATPDSQGVYGFAKLRGNYPTDNEANERAEFFDKLAKTRAPTFSTKYLEYYFFTKMPKKLPIECYF